MTELIILLRPPTTPSLLIYIQIKEGKKEERKKNTAFNVKN